MLTYTERMMLFMDYAEKHNLELLPDQEIEREDMYLAVRNTGVQCRVCFTVDHPMGCILAVRDGGYPYDTDECCKVRSLMRNPEYDGPMGIMTDYEHSESSEG